MTVAPAVPLARIVWTPCWRIIPSRFPPIQLFERVADPDDLEALFALESLTNPRLRDEVGDISLVAAEDRVSGPGSSIVMAAFTHPNPDGSRFADASFGAFYAADTIDTAVAETRHHRERFMRATAQAAMELDMRVYRINLDGSLHDVRGQRDAMPLLYDREDYGTGQALARGLRKAGSYGIAYDSVRWEGGGCVAVFRPPVLSNGSQERHLCYVWNGTVIASVYEKRTLDAELSAGRRQ